jgi:hypothetical protein
MPTTRHTLSTEPDARIRDALTELHTYALVLGGELERVDQQIARFDAQPHDVRELRRRRAEIADQLQLLSKTVIALRVAADPAGRYL